MYYEGPLGVVVCEGALRITNYFAPGQCLNRRHYQFMPKRNDVFVAKDVDYTTARLLRELVCALCSNLFTKSLTSSVRDCITRWLDRLTKPYRRCAHPSLTAAAAPLTALNAHSIPISITVRRHQKHPVPVA